MKVVSPIGVVVLTALRIWLVLGLVVRLTGLRDFAPAVQLLFYSTPWLVQVAGFALLAMWDHAWHERRWRNVSMGLATVALLGWLTASWFWAPRRSEARDFRVVLWNVARPEARFGPVVNYLWETDADIIALAEWEPLTGGGLEKWQEAFPSYRLERFPGEMLLLVRGELVREGDGTLDKGSFFAASRAKIRGRECVLLQADVYGGPLADREPPLQQLTSRARERAGSPVILLGDFNTPRESRLLDPLRAQYRNAFEAAGRGLAETWPVALPVLSLDQIWVGAPFEVLRCEHGFTPFSDHRPVIADLRWRTASSAGR